MKEEDVERCLVLLKAAYDLMKQQAVDFNPLCYIVNYDDAECDGFCLMDEIKAHLKLFVDMEN